LHNEDIESLTFDKNENEKNIPLGRAYQSLLHIFFHHYCNHRAHIAAPIGDNWTAISADDFNDYWMGPDYAAICNVSMIPPPTTGATPQPTWNTPSAVENLKQGIKYDPTLFIPPFKDGKQSDCWQHSTLAQAQAQDVAEVLNTSHAPRAQDENDLFQEKQAMLPSDSSPSTGNAACVSDKADVEFGDASDSLPVPEIAAPADLDQVQVHPQRVLPKPLQVPVILPVPRMPIDNCAKLPLKFWTNQMTITRM